MSLFVIPSLEMAPYSCLLLSDGRVEGVPIAVHPDVKGNGQRLQFPVIHYCFNAGRPAANQGIHSVKVR